jgi:copper(I)-binding protein
MRKVLIIAICLMFALSACGGPAGGIEITDPWARTANEGGNSAVYFEIENGEDDDQLQSATCQIAERTELHRTIVDSDGTARMEHQKHVDVPKGETIIFAKGGLHVMLINLQQALEVGDNFDLTLHFRDSGEVTINVTVQTP